MKSYNKDYILQKRERLSSFFKFSASLWLPSIFLKIWPFLVFNALYSSLARFFLGYYNLPGISPSTLSFVSIAMSMLLVFRTNTAYDRFWEGRKTWGTIEETVSNILRMIRVCVKTDTAKEEQEKLQALKNTVAFAYSVRSYLNEETEVIYPKLYSLLNSQTKNFVQSKSSFHNFHAVDTAVTLVSASSSTQSDRSPILPKVSDRSFRIEDINLPLRLLNQLTEFITNIPDGKIKPTTANLLQMHTNTLSCAFKACLRIQTTPIPQAYSSHLYQTIWLYLLYLPWTLGSSTDLNVVVIQLIVAFMLLGTMVIGEEIEDPFGKDQNDLQTQKFCDNLYDELTFSFEAMNAN